MGRVVSTGSSPSAATDDLPVDDAGHVLPNAWAFLPVFPWLARTVMPVVGGSFWVAGVLVATLAGAGACVVL